MVVSAIHQFCLDHPILQRTFRRYFDATHATAQLAPTSISKFNTLVQLALVGCTLAAPVFHFVDHPALHGLWYAPNTLPVCVVMIPCNKTSFPCIIAYRYLTAGTTVASAMSYMFSKGTYKLLKNKK